MNSVFSTSLLHCLLFFVGLSFVVQGNPIGLVQHPARQLLPPLPNPVQASTPDQTPPTISTPSATSGTNLPSSSTESTLRLVPTSSTGELTSSTSSTITSASTSTPSPLATSITIQLTTQSTTETTIPINGRSTNTASSPPTTTTTSSSSSSDKRTLVIALSVTFSVLGVIALILIIYLLLQCSNSSPRYLRFRLRCFPSSRGGAASISDNEIASWREKPLSPPGTQPNPYLNLVQRYSRPLSFSRPINTSQPLLLQTRRGQQEYSGLGAGLVRPAVPAKLVLPGRSGHYDVENGLSFGNRERTLRSAPLPPIRPPIARAPNSRPGLTDESLPGTPAFILPLHPRRVSRKLSKVHHQNSPFPFSPKSVTSPSTPRPSTSRSHVRKASRRRSMPGMNLVYQEGTGWKQRNFEEDQVVQRGSLGLSSAGIMGLGAHGRSQSDMTPFKEAMRNRPSPGVRPSFEESMARVKEEVPS